MKERLILFETAKLALKKGFRFTHMLEDSYESICHVYNESGCLCKYVNYEPDFYTVTYPDIPAATQSMLQAWLREEHGIIVFVAPIVPECKEFGFTIVPETETSLGFYKTYEDALEAGLLKALTLIL